MTLISREDAIERIANDNVVGGMKRINEYRDSTEHNDYLDGISTAIATVDDLPSAEAEWVPCSERLPDNKSYVLTTIQVSGRQPHARSGFYHDGFFHNDNGDTWRATDREVRAWMPLPKPYGEESEVEE